MELRELKLLEEEIKKISNTVGLSVEDTLSLEIHTEEDFASMAKWIREYDENPFELIDELDRTYIIDPKRNLLENLLLQSNQVFEVDDYILFVYI